MCKIIPDSFLSSVVLVASLMLAPQQARHAGTAKAAPRGRATVISVSCDTACDWTLDDNDENPIAAGGTAKLTIEPGQHVLVAISNDGKDRIKKDFAIEAGGLAEFDLKLLRVRIARLQKELADQQKRIQDFQEGKAEALQEAEPAPPPSPAQPAAPRQQPNLSPAPPSAPPVNPAKPAPSQPEQRSNQTSEPPSQPAQQPTQISALPAQPAPQPVPAFAPSSSPAPAAAEPAQQPNPNPPPPLAPESQAKPEISPAVANNLIISRVLPVYPAAARAAGISGSVVLKFTITRDGWVRDLAIVSGPVLLQKAAWDSVSTWKFTPYVVNGHAVDATTAYSIEFKLKEDAPAAPAPQAPPPAK